MKTTLLSLFIFSFVLINSIGRAQSEDQVVNKILNDEWVLKYKKLKADLENKASNFKEMEGVSEKDREMVRRSYSNVSNRLNQWLDEFLKQCQLPETYQNMQKTGSPVTESLRKDLQSIIALYEDTFNSQYEELTGNRDRNFLLSGSRLISNSDELMASTNIDYSKVEVEHVSRRIRKPLAVANWKEL